MAVLQLKKNTEQLKPMYHIIFFLLYGQKLKQASREHINPTGKHTRFSRVT